MSKLDELDDECGNCAASYGFETCRECEGHISRSGSCELSMEFATAACDELKSDLRTVKRINKKYCDKCDEPVTVGQLMWFMAQDQRYTKHNKDGNTTSVGDFKRLQDIYRDHFSCDKNYNVDGCPRCNAIYLNTTVAELIECLEDYIAVYSTMDYEQADE
jgi:hypothetical protein